MGILTVAAAAGAIWQTVAVAIIIGAVTVYLLIKVFRKINGKDGGNQCCGCALHDSCAKKKNPPKNECKDKK